MADRISKRILSHSLESFSSMGCYGNTDCEVSFCRVLGLLYLFLGDASASQPGEDGRQRARVCNDNINAALGGRVGRARLTRGSKHGL